jgi:hypothetical protein
VGKHEPERRTPPAGRPGARRPTPVRELMEGPAGSESEEAEEAILDVDGERWRVCAIGSGRTGTAPDDAATLLMLGFTEAEGAGGEEREVLVVARSLSDLGLEDLREAFARSRTRERPSQDGAVQRSVGGRPESI